MFTLQQLQTIVNLIIAGGKAPATGADGMMQAAQAIMWIKEREALMIAQQPPAVPPPPPAEEHPTNGAAAH